jgi:hypothetical protein
MLIFSDPAISEVQKKLARIQGGTPAVTVTLTLLVRLLSQLYIVLHV